MRVSDIRTMLAKSTELPPFPLTGQKAIILASKNDVDIAALGEIISSDQAMASKVLQLANSAEFAPNRTINKVSDAIIYIGLKEVRKVIFLVMAHSAFLGIQDQETWYHAVSTAHIAQEIASSHSATLDVHEAMITGLLHDVGRTFLVTKRSAEYKVVMGRVEAGTSLIVAERDMFEIDHAEVGAIMASRWKLPGRIEQAIRNHHSTGPLPDILDRVIVLANQLADNARENDPMDGPINERVMQSLNITPESAKKIVEVSKARVDDFLSTLYHIF